MHKHIGRFSNVPACLPESTFEGDKGNEVLFAQSQILNFTSFYF